MAKSKGSALMGVFDDDEPAQLPAITPVAEVVPTIAPKPRPTRTPATSASKQGRAGASRNHGTKKPVLIHIPEDMHRTLRQLSVEEGGEPLTVVTERLLRQYLVGKGHVKFAPAKAS